MSTVEPDEKALLETAMEQRDLHGPAWRWDLADELRDCWPGRLLERFGHDFANVQHYRTLCGRSEAGRHQAVTLYPALATAESLNADLQKTGQLKIAILGDVDPQEIRQYVDVDEVVLRTWERTFFDVRGTGLATHWINSRVIQPELAAGRHDLAARLRMVAAVGPLGAQAILKADNRLPVREAQKLFDRDLKLHVKFNAAVAMTPDTTKTRLSFIKLHAKLQIEKQRLKLAREKLQQKCAEAIDRQALAKIEAELAMERERNRAAARSRRQEADVLAEMGEEQSRRWLAQRRREKELAQQATIAARIAASPLSQLRWQEYAEPNILPFDASVESKPARKMPDNPTPVPVVLSTQAPVRSVGQPASA